MSLKFALLLSFLFSSAEVLAFHLDCGGTIFRALESDVDQEELKDPGGSSQIRYTVKWGIDMLTIGENGLQSSAQSATVWKISRKNLSFEKSVIRVGEREFTKSKGQCEIWKKPADNAI